ncbi:MAG: DNA/RNA non-specific endonuclease [Betaproteobacteria bacterium]|nr:MAG: DNA/RNA non-specific endonuclease [Betaproteobacteria bacterium]
MNLFRFVLTLWLCVPLLAQAAFDACLDYFPKQQIPVTQTVDAQDLCFDGFAVLHSKTTKTPIYAVERLNKGRIQEVKGKKRTNRFYEEARVPHEERARLEDYKGSGYDRGHVAPAGDMDTPAAMAHSFSLANMVPQVAKHNRGVWNKIERDTRNYAMQAAGDVFVFTGPWYDPAKPAAYAGRVRVPDVLWKAVYDATTGQTRVHWSENAETVTPHALAYDEFVARTGLKVF